MAAPRKVTGKGGKRAAARRPAFVVGIGGSAGGLEALEQFFAHIPPSTGMAFVVVTHLDPDHKALLPELIQRVTAMPVREIEDGVRITPDTVLVMPPAYDVVIEADVLHLRPRSPRRTVHLPIDVFFRSLARERGQSAIAVVLSGMGTDGALGLRDVAEAGGRTLVQDPKSAAFAPMPRAALAAVPSAVVARADQLPAQLTVNIASIASIGGDTPAPAAAGAGRPLARVLDGVHRHTGYDLSRYKPSSIQRRVERRLVVHKLATLDAYATYLDASPEEAQLLLSELLIGVTQFFRDEEVFVTLRDVALPALLAAKDAPRTLRAWVAGCSTGEEAYSLAIVFREMLAHAHALDVAVQIYATDIDKHAIETARTGHYPHDIASQMSAERLADNFVRDDGGYRIRKELRETVVFAHHDLITDPPFTRLDVLCCRNVLIYFQSELQQMLMPRFHYALAPGGLLVLGPAESVTSAEELFTPIDPKGKVFQRIAALRPSSKHLELLRGVRPGSTTGAQAPRLEPTLAEAAHQIIVDDLAPVTVVINDRGDLLYSSRRATRYLEPPVGKVNVNIYAMAREGLGRHLGIAIRKAIERRRRVMLPDVLVRGDRGTYRVDLTVVPMTEPASLRGLLLVAFSEVPVRAGTATKGKQPRATRTTRAADRELAQTKAHLQNVVRDMEISQAQLEATNEELQSTNEELQSTNEEVTTSKEELQSMNEELVTLNTELEATNDHLATANDDLRNLLNSTKIPTLFLDNALRIKRFTNEATRIANVIAGDVGRMITDLTLKIAYHELARDVRSVIETLVSTEIPVTGLDGTRYAMRIHPYRTMDNLIDGVVITFFDVTSLRLAEEALAIRASDDAIARLLDRWPGMVYLRDLALQRDVYLNERARACLQAVGGAGERFESLFAPPSADDTARWLVRLEALRDGEVVTRMLHLRDSSGAYTPYRARESVITRSPTGAPTRVLSVIEAEFTPPVSGQTV
ncbi:MAG: PAS domain-containing protein [Myxococcales bacterium]|nr:PAS domain-containing protein [Myxococcales bacterium]